MEQSVDTQDIRLMCNTFAFYVSAVRSIVLADEAVGAANHTDHRRFF
jgi:hypothetical protein